MLRLNIENGKLQHLHLTILSILDVHVNILRFIYAKSRESPRGALYCKVKDQQ